MRRLVLATISLGALAAVAIPATAQELPKVTVGTDDGVSVSVTDKGQPVVGGFVRPGDNACVGISYQRPICTDR